ESVEQTRTRAKILERTKGKVHGEPLLDEEVAAESAAASERTPHASSEPDKYDAEIDLPNEHTWKRGKDGVWCRFSNGGVCDIRFNPKGAEPVPAAAAPTPAPRPDVEATRVRMEQAGEARAVTQARLAEAKARADQASKNLKFASDERLKAA